MWKNVIQTDFVHIFTSQSWLNSFLWCMPKANVNANYPTCFMFVPRLKTNNMAVRLVVGSNVIQLQIRNWNVCSLCVFNFCSLVWSTLATFALISIVIIEFHWNHVQLVASLFRVQLFVSLKPSAPYLVALLLLNIVWIHLFLTY